MELVSNLASVKTAHPLLTAETTYGATPETELVTTMLYLVNNVVLFNLTGHQFHALLVSLV